MEASMRKKVKSCFLGEVEYKVSWDISMSLIYYMVIQKGKTYIILSYQAGFLKKDSQICLDKGSLIQHCQAEQEKGKRVEEDLMAACKIQPDSWKTIM